MLWRGPDILLHHHPLSVSWLSTCCGSRSYSGQLQLAHSLWCISLECGVLFLLLLFGVKEVVIICFCTKSCCTKTQTMLRTYLFTYICLHFSFVTIFPHWGDVISHKEYVSTFVNQFSSKASLFKWEHAEVWEPFVSRIVVQYRHCCPCWTQFSMSFIWCGDQNCTMYFK